MRVFKDLCKKIWDIVTLYTHKICILLSVLEQNFQKASKKNVDLKVHNIAICSEFYC